ncbi:unnamed protein product [Linum tenue]|uniref:Uncharacterized protein n=1 Tax=Linum tenue TaxID=586396 RepID=A0AAV0HKW5_9ROSI|nr:unnamed protein product [Linum tenue]
MWISGLENPRACGAGRITGSTGWCFCIGGRKVGLMWRLAWRVGLKPFIGNYLK